MRILHVSDIHHDVRKVSDEAPVRSALLLDIETAHKEQRFDAVVFTGDLVFSGSDIDSFESAREQWIVPILDRIELGTDSVVIVPGNHDIDPRAVDVAQDSATRQSLTSADALNSYVDDPAGAPRLEERVANFYTVFDREPIDRDVVVLGRQFAIQTKESPLYISAANSAWRATGRPENYDEGHLLVGERQMQYLVSGLGDDGLRIFACHHPIDWLAAFDRDNVLQAVHAHYHLVLFGHTHVPKPSLGTDEFGAAVVSQGGSLYRGAHESNEYTIIDVGPDSRTVTLSFRAYVPRRRAFDVDPERAPGGTLTLPLPSTSGGTENSLRPVYRDLQASLRRTHSEEVSLLQYVDHADADPFDLLIEPVCYGVPRSSRRMTADQTSGSERVPLNEVIATHSAVVIFGGKEAGKTCALYWTLASAMEKSESLGLYIDFADIASGPNGTAKAIRHALRRIGLSAREDLSDAPELVIAVDNFAPTGTRTAERFLRFIADNPGIRWILGVEDDGFAPAIQTWMPPSVSGRSVYLGPYQSNEIRALTRTLYPDAADTWDQIFESVTGIILNQGLPRTPWTVVMVLLLYRYEPALAATDVTALVDKYVDLVLGKWQIAPSTREQGLDYTNRRHFLMCLAVALNDSPSRQFTEETLHRFTTDYLARFGLEIDVRSFVDDLVDRHVIGGNSQAIRFVPPDVQQFFLALAAREGEADVTTLLGNAPENFDAIVHLNGLTRNRRDVLVTLSERIQQLSRDLGDLPAKLFERVGSDAWVGLPGLEKTVESLERMGRHLGHVQSAEARDMFADELFERREDVDRSDEDAVPSAARGALSFINEVALLSLCFQRSELVPDQKLKIDIVVLLLRAWACGFSALCALEAEMTDEEQRARASALSAAGLSERQVETFEQLHIFVDIAVLAMATMSSSKMSKAIREAGETRSLHESELVARLLYAIVVAFADVEGWEATIRDVLDRYSTTPHVARLTYLFLTWKYFDFDTPVPTQRSIELVLGDLAAKEYAVDRQSKNAKSQFIDTLRRTRALNGQRTAIDRNRLQG